MNRNVHLNQSLPTWLNAPFSEIIIVDWSSIENVFSVTEKFNDRRLLIVQVKNQKYFDRGAAWNVGIKHATGPFIHCLDCDVKIIDPHYLYRQDLKENVLYLAKAHAHNTHNDTPKNFDSLFGSNIITKKMWEEVNGYTEEIDTWGYEDRYFYKKLKDIGYKIEVGWKDGCLKHIDHDNTLRVKYHKLQFNNDINKCVRYAKEQTKNKDSVRKYFDFCVYNYKGELVDNWDRACSL